MSGSELLCHSHPQFNVMRILVLSIIIAIFSCIYMQVPHCYFSYAHIFHLQAHAWTCISLIDNLWSNERSNTEVCWYDPVKTSVALYMLSNAG